MLTDHVQFCNSNRLSIAMYLICDIHFISVTCLLLGAEIFTNISVLARKSFPVAFNYHVSAGMNIANTSVKFLLRRASTK